MYSKQNIPFPWDEFNQQRLYVTFESYEDFEDFVTFLAKKRNHYWAKQKRKGLRELWDNLNMYLYHFAITANAVKPLSIIDKQVKPYGCYFYTSPVLDDVERKWLKNFTSLFRNAVFISVTKHIETLDGEYSYLTFSYDENGERRGLILPSFKTADMYKGMVNGHVYDFDKLMENKG